MAAYQTSNHAYQGVGQFVYQTTTATSAQPGMLLREAGRREAGRRYVFRKFDLSDFYDDFTEEDFLQSVEETIQEAEKPGKPKLAKEIGKLSALETLSRAYGAHFDSVKAARAAIKERRVELVEPELTEDEMFAIMMILALADEP